MLLQQSPIYPVHEKIAQETVGYIARVHRSIGRLYGPTGEFHVARPPENWGVRARLLETRKSFNFERLRGDPYGNRTRVSAVKGPRPNR